MRFSCICWRGNQEGENKEPFSGQVSHHPLLFWLTAVLPDVNLLPGETLVKLIGRQVNTKYRGEERKQRVRKGRLKKTRKLDAMVVKKLRNKIWRLVEGMTREEKEMN